MSQILKRLAAIKAFPKLGFDDDHDHKKARKERELSPSFRNF
jgi:hypothetical protein